MPARGVWDWSVDVMIEPYRLGTKHLTQHKYRDGYIVWNWELLKWDYFCEEMK